MIWERIEQVLAPNVAVDLGTVNTLIYVRHRGIVLMEPTAIAVDRADGRVIALGREALSMLGREPREIAVHRPVRSGVVADYELTEKLLRGLLERALGHRLRAWVFPRLVLGTPSGVTFIPPHLAEEVVTYSEDIRQRDVFGKQRLAEGVYTSGQIDVPVWAEEIEADYLAWCEERGLAATRRR